MRVFGPCSLLLAAAAPLAIVPHGAIAQIDATASANPDADALAAQMRLLGANALDLDALIRAGELTLRLDDPTAAAAFFARAERIDPRNPRIKAGLGSLLVGEERPGEALRRFAEAESLGADVGTFAADRGLAYDLIGEQERAQRDYRAALRREASDETARRYALSLGIAGKRDQAFELLEPLLRRSDRGAWRDRAFILAMSGDRAGAEKIATSMLPAGVAQGLAPFFERLPSLPAADRAFAVHFGELRPGPERLFDARLVPPLPVLGADPYAPVAVAAVRAAPAGERRDDRRRGRKRKGAAIDLATAAPPVPLPAPPAYVAANDADVPPPRPAYPVYPPAAPLPGRSTAMVQPLPGRAGAGAPAVVVADRVSPVPRQETPARIVPPETAAPSPSLPVPVPPSRPVVLAVAQAVPVPASAALATVAADSPAAAPSPAPVTKADTVAATIALAPPPAASVAVPSPPAQVPSPAVATVRPAPVRSEESILASIIAGITVADPAPEPAVSAPPQPAKLASATPLPPVNGRKPSDDTPAAEKKAADRKAADRKAADAKKAAELKKAADRKAADEKAKHDPKKLEPSRLWVQVAGGANEDTLPKEWARVRDKAPAAFKGKQGWTTPLRATNRVLAGPFASEDEARSFVNTLAKQGISAFTFTSEAGQKITRLAGK